MNTANIRCVRTSRLKVRVVGRELFRACYTAGHLAVTNRTDKHRGMVIRLFRIKRKQHEHYQEISYKLERSPMSDALRNGHLFIMRRRRITLKVQHFAIHQTYRQLKFVNLTLN